jgi:hypothetical protein
MSNDFLTRWSRRKRDVEETEQAKSAPAPAPGARDTIFDRAIPEDATPIECVQGNAATPPEPAFDLESLPPIESITAATDIRPFLAPGVPVEVTRAALRRAWSADPRIRDFVGLADYDWDYHTPGSAAGFGPLEMTDELRRMVARILGEIVDTETSKGTGEPATGTECAEESQPPRAVVRAEANGLDAPSGGSRPAESHLGHTGPAAALGTTSSAASQHETPRDHAPRLPIRRGHGRALPK